MQKTLTTRTKQLLILIMCSITVSLAGGRFKGGHTGYARPADATVVAADSPASLKDHVEVELITLRAFGFEPAEITRPKGAFVLFIDDRSGKQDSSLVLQRAAKDERLRAINLNRKKSEWNDVVDLSPGIYVLQDAGNPELRCQITILP